MKITLHQAHICKPSNHNNLSFLRFQREDQLYSARHHIAFCPDANKLLNYQFTDNTKLILSSSPFKNSTKAKLVYTSSDSLHVTTKQIKSAFLTRASLLQLLFPNKTTIYFLFTETP